MTATFSPVVRIKDIVMVPVAKLVPHPKNPNVHPPEQIERLAQIIEARGWRRGITVSNQSGFMTVGHGRLMAALLRKWPEVPVSFQDYENEADEYSDMVADNAIAEWAEMDRTKISADAIEFGDEFDIDLLGIKNFVLDIDGLNHDLDDKQNKSDETKHFLEVELSSEKEMLEVYEELLSRGLIVRYK